MLFLLSFLLAEETLYKLNKLKMPTSKEITKLRCGNKLYTFFTSTTKLPTKRIQYHIPFLVKNLVRMKGTPIIYEMKKIKYTIYPFDKVIMSDGKNDISLGNYSKSVLKDGNYYQNFTCGQNCDLNKKIERTTVICFKSMVGELRVDSFIERKLCQYEMVVGGDSLTRCIKNIQSVEYVVEDIKNEEVTTEENVKEDKD